MASVCRKCWPRRNSSTKNCRCSRKSCVRPTKSLRSSRGF
ncbi:hypothetical protein [Pseudomonas viridiflava]